MRHVPVMWKEVLENLPEKLNVFMDGTLWHAGHTKLIIENKSPNKVIWVDKDPKIIKVAEKNLVWFDNVQFVNDSYKNLDKFLDSKVSWMLLDLWVNMEHFKDASRGFSIKKDWPLDMRFDPNSWKTAKDILRTYSTAKLSEIFQKYWDFSWRLLDLIVSTIEKWRFWLETTYDLKNLLKNAWINEKKIAVIFQVLRIETNNELDQLEEFLSKFQDYLEIWWRCLIITYHSIEDRLVKNRFKELDKNWFKNLTKKVIFPTWAEIQKNRASRSAKLRVIEKVS